MTFRTRGVIGVAIVCLFAGVLYAGPALADGRELDAAVRKAADRMLATQGDYANGDTGTGTYPCSWQWLIAPGNPANKNIQGPSALGLLAGYEATRKAKYLAGVTCAADQMVARYDASTERAYAQDIEFLVRYSEVTHKRIYKQKAAQYHIRTRTAFPTGAALADYYIAKRFSLAGWDLAGQIRAAQSVGQFGYANQIGNRLIERQADWVGVPCGGWDYTLIGYADLLRALDDTEGKNIRSFRKDAAAAVLASQESDGSWWGADYQSTAFAILGLATVPQNAHVKKAIRNALEFLLQTQDMGGGWVYPDPAWGESGEVNGEVLLALVAMLDRDDERDEDRR